MDPPGDALELASRFATRRDGHATPTLLATFLHHHPGGDPSAVAAFVAACAASRRYRSTTGRCLMPCRKFDRMRSTGPDHLDRS